MTVEKEKTQSLQSGSFKIVLYVVLLAASLSLLNMIFGWASPELIPLYLQPYSGIILFVYPYLAYIQAGLIFVFGYLAINAVAEYKN